VDPDPSNDADPDPQNGTQTCSVYADPLGPDPTGLGVADIRQQNIETQALPAQQQLELKTQPFTI
jgi:hypothetical protein